MVDLSIIPDPPLFAKPAGDFFPPAAYPCTGGDVVRRLFLMLLSTLVLALFLALPVLLAGPEQGSAAPTPAPTAAPTAAPAGFSCAVWVSYLEWQGMDFSSADAFTADIRTLMDDIAALGADTVLAQVRPFGDALYPSDYYPFSHLCTGVQGTDPGFDPLAILVREAHARGLELEAWINPYRLRAGGVPSALCASSPAVTHPEWVREAAGGLYLDPANSGVRQYIADGLAELCSRYDIDGIHFDDYFYPTTDPAFDAADYAASGTALPLDDWRRENVNALVRLCAETVRARGVRFGIAPQGDPDLNYSAQYSDAALWLAEGWVDYLMPQLYWGQEYTKNGDASHSLTALAARWLAYPRAAGVRLCFGLGAYRIGDGDGGDAGAAEWRSGGALAAQLEALAALGAQGAGLYRYGSLFQNTAWPELAGQETEKIRCTLAAGLL